MASWPDSLRRHAAKPGMTSSHPVILSLYCGLCSFSVLESTGEIRMHLNESIVLTSPDSQIPVSGPGSPANVQSSPGSKVQIMNVSRRHEIPPKTTATVRHVGRVGVQHAFSNDVPVAFFPFFCWTDVQIVNTIKEEERKKPARNIPEMDPVSQSWRMIFPRGVSTAHHAADPGLHLDSTSSTYRTEKLSSVRLLLWMGGQTGTNSPLVAAFQTLLFVPLC